MLGASAARVRAVFHQAAILITRLSLISAQEVTEIYAMPDRDGPQAAWESCCREVAESIRRAIGLA